ncbi:hypothetical protein [Ilumatobacter sp.]|uniref:hypothetical protein n=1 Tax=Ilumatobacter sp. TaxID=1967498 RepID=UPI003C6B0F6A
MTSDPINAMVDIVRPMSGQRFPIRFTGANRAMVVLGMSSRNSFIDVGDEVVTVRMGWAFSTSIPRAAVHDAADDDRRVLGWGAHGWRGRWLVNGSSSGIVCVRIDPATSARLMSFIPVSLRELRISVDEPAELISTLQG